jgi:hypothetical protein
MPFNSRNEGSECVFLTRRASSARPDLARVQIPEELRLAGNARAHREVAGRHLGDDEVAFLLNLAEGAYTRSLLSST